jgi:ribosome-associated protein
MLKINHHLAIPAAELNYSYSRSPGPGGQNVNKVNSKVTLRWNVQKTTSLPPAILARFKRTYVRRINNDGELILTSHRHRDQGRNVADVLNKLRELVLAIAVEPKKRKATKPTKASKRRRLEQKRRNSLTKRSRRSVRPDD